MRINKGQRFFIEKATIGALGAQNHECELILDGGSNGDHGVASDASNRPHYGLVVRIFCVGKCSSRLSTDTCGYNNTVWNIGNDVSLISVQDHGKYDSEAFYTERMPEVTNDIQKAIKAIVLDAIEKWELFKHDTQTLGS